MDKLFLAGFTRGEVDRNVTMLPYGDHDAKIVKIWVTDSQHKSSSDSDLKKAEELGAWRDPVKQLAVTFQGIDPDTGKPIGIITRRFQTTGYVKYEELEDLGYNPDDYFFSPQEGYAIHEQTLTRVVSEVRTKQALNILNEFLENAGVAEGTQLETQEQLEEALIGKMVHITVSRRTYDGKDRGEVTRIKAYADVPNVE